MSTLPLRTPPIRIKLSPPSFPKCGLSTVGCQLSFPLSPLQSALPQNAPITPLESALPKTQHLKPFRIRTYEKIGGGVGANC